MKKTIFVVEGKHDIARLKQINTNIEVVSVNGSAIDQQVVELLKERQAQYNIVILTDPDYPGERIRHYLEQQLDHVDHVFIERQDAISHHKKKIGIEHVNIEVLKQAIETFRQTVKQESMSDIVQIDLYEFGLIGQSNSKQKRELVSKALKLGHVNGKTLLKRIHLFDISKKEIEEVLLCITK